MRSSLERDDQPLFGPLPSQRTSGKGARLGFLDRTSDRPIPERSAGLEALPAYLKMLWPVPSPLRWSTFGFVAGALFWHFVGFWTFMSHIVFSTPDAAWPSSIAASAVTTSSAQTRGDPIETGSLQRLEKLTAPKVEPSCTAVSRDPVTGDASQGPCQKLKRPMKVLTGTNRQDIFVPAKETKPAAASLVLDPSLPLEWPPAATKP